jgi:hypothetical protein
MPFMSSKHRQSWGSVSEANVLYYVFSNQYGPAGEYGHSTVDRSILPWADYGQACPIGFQCLH